MSPRPCVGRLGSDPVEMDLFDVDSNGRVQVALLPHVCVCCSLTIPYVCMYVFMYICMYVRPLGNAAHPHVLPHPAAVCAGNAEVSEQITRCV